MSAYKEFVAMHYKYNPSGATSVDWYVGKRCNFDCSYCVEYLHDNHSPHVPFENMKTFADYVFSRSGNNVIWSLTGGEPTLNPHFVELCKYLKSKNSRHISVTTNGSRTTKYFLELYPYLDNITLSLHMEYVDKKLSEYMDKILELEKFRITWNREHEQNGGFDFEKGHQPKQLLVRFMVFPDQLEEIKQAAATLTEKGVEKVEYRVIRPLTGDPNEQMPSQKLEYSQNHDLKEHARLAEKPRITWDVLKQKARKKLKALEWYSDKEKKSLLHVLNEDPKKQLRLFSESNGQLVSEDYHYNKLNFENKSNFEGWYCWAGVKHLKITPTGDIYIGSCHVGGRRGNIFEPEKGIDLPSEAIKCPKWRCTDNLDLRVPKIKSMKYYDLIRHLVEK